MTGTGSGWLSGLMTAPVALAIVATLTALVLALLVAVPREVRLRALVSLIGFALVLAALVVLIDRLSADRQAAERRALLERAGALERAAVAPGSPLACLDAGLGDTVENGCEKAVFGSAQNAAAAVGYMAARLRLIADAANNPDPRVAAALAASRRAIELDRFGLAAQALAAREGCTAERCAAFALLGETDALKANMKARVFEQYVSRHADAWNAPGEKQPALSALPAPVPAVPGPPKAPQPLSDKYDFPSAASIPPVSIMNAEPKLPANADAPPAAAPNAALPLPPKRPAPSAPAR